jgi:hypothetical protein
MEVKLEMPVLPGKRTNEKIPFKLSLQLSDNSITLFVECLDNTVSEAITGPSERGISWPTELRMNLFLPEPKKMNMTNTHIANIN